MEYTAFHIENYRAIRKSITLDLIDKPLIPLVGINECGKTTILQAIFSFDYINDKENDGKHLENTLNLYQTEEPDPVISADIKIDGAEFISCIQDFKTLIQTKNPNSLSAEDLAIIDQLLAGTNYKPILLTVARNLKTKKYLLNRTPLSSLLPETQDKAAREIIQSLPYILYNDDFTDRPVTSIGIPPTKPDQWTGWLSIYEKLFNVSKEGYSIFSLITEKDDRRKDSILSDVQDYLDKTLTEEWKTFNLGKKEDIYVKFTLIKSPQTPEFPNKLNIRIIEKIGPKERFFEVIDRSKGFLWFYNFVMKLQFNPKQTDNNKTVYLLDEPGSYLHSTAQENLCTKIKKISKSQGLVIYCTHSHHLLNPNEIPLNTIYIVEKGRDKSITVVPLPKIKTKTEKTHALQPILEALYIPACEFFKSTDPVLLVEGIYDKYAIELFTPLELKLNIMPGASADSIIKNIQLMLGFNKLFIAIWDNDPEGKLNYDKAKKLFGQAESERFDLLPCGNIKKRRMEDMFDGVDYIMMKKALNLPNETRYETIITSVYYSTKATKKRLMDNLSQSTKANFDILKQIIEKRIDKATKLAE